MKMMGGEWNKEKKKKKRGFCNGRRSRLQRVQSGAGVVAENARLLRGWWCFSLSSYFRHLNLNLNQSSFYFLLSIFYFLLYTIYSYVVLLTYPHNHISIQHLQISHTFFSNNTRDIKLKLKLKLII